MRRRDFIKLSTVAGVAGVVGSRIDTAAANPLYEQASGFDLHPFIKAHPEAVFIYITDVKEKTDQKGTYDAGNKLAREMFVSTSGGAGFSNSTKIAAKPNWTCSPEDREEPTRAMGITTDLGFTEGYLNGVKSKGPQQFYLRECACPNQWDRLGFTAMAQRNNFDLRVVNDRDPWEYEESGENVFKMINNGVVFREMAYLGPMAAPDSFLVSLAKFKTHGMGVTGAVKNLQGISARRLNSFCGFNDAFRSLPAGYHRFFQPNYLDRIRELHQQHIAAGFPRWNGRMGNNPFNSGLWMEHWVQKACDTHSVLPVKTAGISVIEGIYGRDGDGFAAGPHNGKAMDFMYNVSLFGLDPFRLDIIAHWLACHEPGNMGLFHIGIERGLLDVLDPFDIPVYTWSNGRARSTRLNRIKRLPLLMYYNHQEGEDYYHLCNEPFDYKYWKANGRIRTASIETIGTDSNNNIVMDMTVPEKGDVYVDIMNSNGELVWRMRADDLEPGNHQVVWDGFYQPGIYHAYVKGMGWDAEREMVIYS